MNKLWVRFHLQEAQEELARIERAIETDPSFEEVEFLIAIAHPYHHLNTAWNSRSADEHEIARHSEELFLKWRQFPTDILLD